MNTVICTLFEGNYHFGLAALTNSLFKQGFVGDIYAGYRGDLPGWSSDAIANEELNWEGAKTLTFDGSLRLHFLPLSTTYHFTNYKPDFMLELWDGPAKSAQNIFYMDPDLVVTVKWSAFELWVKAGVTLCEDVNSPLAENFPRRVAWRNYFAPYGINLTFKEAFYVNGGFVGVHKRHRSFIEIWKNLQELMAKEIGGLDRSSIQGIQIDESAKGIFAPFGKTDQDALNATIEASDAQVSIAGKEAMGFIAGWPLLPHALGQPKPWASSALADSFSGYPPRQIDKQYWIYANGIIHTTATARVVRKKIILRIAAFIGRFYRRS